MFLFVDPKVHSCVRLQPSTLQWLLPRIIWDLHYESDGQKLIDSEKVKRNSGRLLFNANYVVSVFVEHLCTLLVFGLIFPLLGVVIVVSICAYMCEWWLLIARYLHFASISNNTKVASVELESTTTRIIHYSFYEIWTVCTLTSTLLFSLLIVDIAGDDKNVSTLSLIFFSISCYIFVLILWSIFKLKRDRYIKEALAYGSEIRFGVQVEL